MDKKQINQNFTVQYSKKHLRTLMESFEKKFGYFKELELISKRIQILEEKPVGNQDTVQSSYFLHMGSLNLSEVKKWITESFSERKGTISFCLIVKNEERCILRCLESIEKYADEIIVVDTGSIDTTLEIVRQFSPIKVKIIEVEWKNSFSLAKNEGLKNATKEWVYFMDADNWFEEKEIKQLSSYLSLLNNYPDKSNVAFAPKIIQFSGSSNRTDPKLINRKSGIHFFGFVHEELRNKTANTPVRIIAIDVEMLHDGYEKEILESKKKKERNVSLLLKNIEIEPENPRWAYMLARDGKEILGYEQSKNLCLTFLKRDASKLLSINNICQHNYTILLLNELANIYLTTSDLENLEKTNDIIGIIQPNSFDYTYFSYVKRMFELKSEYGKLLNSLLLYRKVKDEDKTSIFCPEGHQIDLLIAILLYENGFFEESKTYFNHLISKNYINKEDSGEMIKKYVDILRL